VVQLPRRRHRRRLRLRRCAHRGGRGNRFRFLLAVREFRLCACVRVPFPTCHYEKYRLRICHDKVLSYLCAMHLKFVYVRAIPSIFCEKITVLRI
jgi:hypothetical protein